MLERWAEGDLTEQPEGRRCAVGVSELSAVVVAVGLPTGKTRVINGFEDARGSIGFIGRSQVEEAASSQPNIGTDDHGGGRFLCSSSGPMFTEEKKGSRGHWNEK